MKNISSNRIKLMFILSLFFGALFFNPLSIHAQGEGDGDDWECRWDDLNNCCEARPDGSGCAIVLPPFCD